MELISKLCTGSRSAYQQLQIGSENFFRNAIRTPGGSKLQKEIQIVWQHTPLWLVITNKTITLQNQLSHSYYHYYY